MLSWKFLQWFVLGFSVLIANCSRPALQSPAKDPYALDTLIFLDETLLDIWEGDSNKEDALARLRYSCRNADTSDGFICYSWGLIEYKQGHYEESYSAFQKALEKNPNDSLYKNLLRLAAIGSRNLPDLENKSKEGEVFALYSKALETCDFDSVLRLGQSGFLSLEQSRKGRFSECLSAFTADQKTQLLPLFQKRKEQYSELLTKEKVKRDRFSKVWDTEPYHQGISHNEVTNYQKPVSEAWRKFREAAINNREADARKTFSVFWAEVQTYKKKGKEEAILATALERSAKLLIEQDPTYKNVRFLSKEF